MFAGVSRVRDAAQEPLFCCGWNNCQTRDHVAMYSSGGPCLVQLCLDRNYSRHRHYSAGTEQPSPPPPQQCISTIPAAVTHLRAISCHKYCDRTMICPRVDIFFFCFSVVTSAFIQPPIGDLESCFLSPSKLFSFR